MTKPGFEIAMVLAAGRGERMRPLTSVLPKPALPTPDGPVVGSSLRLAASAGATRVAVNAFHLANKLVEAVSEVKIDGVEIKLSVEDELMGTAGGLALARDRSLLGSTDSVLVINGDGALGLDLRGFAAHHRARCNLVTLALLPHLDPGRWSRIVLDGDGRVVRIHAPGVPNPLEAPFLYPGVMAVHREALDALPTAPSDIPDALWAPARSAGRLGGLVTSGHWREVGTPNDYLEIVLLRLAGGSVIHPSAEVGRNTSITQSFVGRDVVIGDGSTVKRSVVAEGAVIGDGAWVEHSVVLGAVRVDCGDVLSDSVRAEPGSS